MAKLFFLSLKLYKLVTTGLCKRTYSSSNDVDLVVIGSGPAGYVCAVRAAQFGLKTVCIEKNPTLGGTCLNIGCIPAKALLSHSYYYSLAKSGELARRGIEIDNIRLNLNALMNQKNIAVTELTSGVSKLFNKNDIQLMKGHGKITNVNQVTVLKEDGTSEVIKSNKIIIATGSEHLPLTGFNIDEKSILSSTGAMSLKKVPKRLIIIGCGIIALELGTVWLRLGSKVTIIGNYSTIGGPGIDEEISKSLQKILIKQGLSFKLNTVVKRVVKSGGIVKVSIQTGKDISKTEDLESNAILVSVGRKPYTHNLGLEEIGIARDERGYIPVNSMFQTAVPTIYGIGDCIHGPMLARKAAEDGIMCVEGITGRPVPIDKCIPFAIFTQPEVAWVGKSERELKNEGINYKVGKFPFLANSRAKTNNDVDGFIKVLADKTTDRILGTHIIGHTAGELINEATLAQQYGASSEDIARACHAHPTCAEALKEANLACYFGKAINF